MKKRLKGRREEEFRGRKRKTFNGYAIRTVVRLSRRNPKNFPKTHRCVLSLFLLPCPSPRFGCHRKSTEA